MPLCQHLPHDDAGLQGFAFNVRGPDSGTNQEDKHEMHTNSASFAAFCTDTAQNCRVARTIGPMLQPTPNMTMLSLRNWFQNGRPNGVCPNDSMSFVDVRDCAEQHIKAMEDPAAEGRYMSLVPSWHWNDLDHTMHEMYPLMPKSAPCEGTPCASAAIALQLPDGSL